MRILSFLSSLLVLLVYVVLMRRDTAWGLLAPRGGMVMLAVSLAIANVFIWMSTDAHRALSTQFQLAAAGWIWILVQGGSITYLWLHAAGR